MALDDLEPDDREKLVKMKFKELFTECLEESFGEMFDKRVKETYGAAGKQQPEPQQQQQQQSQDRQQPKRRTSLFEQALSQSLGIK